MEEGAHKAAAIEFMQMVAAGQIHEAFRKHVGPEFKHHNAYFPGDRQSLLVAMEENHASKPHKELVVKQAIEEGDLVALHSHMKPQPDSLGVALVHIFRFHSDQIVELWDLGQPISKDSPNLNGVF
jgi:predicted SnoaL-like aldol condensation-catalyzing enzyme